MSKLNFKSLTDKCQNMVQCTKNAVCKAKDISVHPKINAALTLKSKKSDRTLFDCKINTDREFSLFNMIAAAVCAAALLAMIAAAVKACFCCENCKDETDE